MGTSCRTPGVAKCVGPGCGAKVEASTGGEAGLGDAVSDSHVERESDGAAEGVSQAWDGGCNPGLCPSSGFGQACCVTPDGPCGTDVGSGCMLPPYPESSCVDQCPVGDGQYPRCAECTVSSSGDPVPDYCGFKVEGNCLQGPERIDTCHLPGCPTEQGWSSCCPDGQPRCGGTGECGLRQIGYNNYQAKYGGTAVWWEGFPDGCVSLHEPGVEDSSCPAGLATKVASEVTPWSLLGTTTRTPISLPGCRRPDGTCGVWFDDPPFGCVDKSVLKDPDGGAAVCGSGLVQLPDGGADAGVDSGADGDSAADGALE